tara:strand:- start:792 stop:1388 length:597 start_codon:yes stop_codon:yes gene_type:complete
MAAILENRNFLAPTGFNFVVEKAQAVDFFCQSANVPSISMIPTVQPGRLRNIPVPGDELYYEDLSVRFLVDEEMKNYLEIHDWLTTLGFPEYWGQYDFEQQKDDKRQPFASDDMMNSRVAYSRKDKYERSDANLQILNSNYNVIQTIHFKDIFPISLSTLTFDTVASDVQYLSASATFKYTHYNIRSTEGRTDGDWTN